MINNDMDLPFHMDKSKFYPETHVRCRVVSNKDWHRVDWSNGNLLDPNKEVQ